MGKFMYLLIILSIYILETKAKQTVPRLAPLDPPFPSAFKSYYNAEFARYVLHPKCEWAAQRTKYIPIYYNDGDRVALPCTVCRVTDEHHQAVAKIWRRAKEPKDIFKLTNVAKAEQWVDLKDWVNKNNSNDQFGNFIQKDGNLVIRNMSYRAHGLYNCYPQGQPQIAEIVYELHAMMPPMTNPYVGITDSHMDTFDPNTGDICDPNSNRLCRTGEKWHSYSNCERGANPYWHLEFFPHYTPLAAEKESRNLALNLQFQFQWEPWSECKGNGPSLRRREGHCYMKQIDTDRSLCPISGSCDIGENPDAWIDDAFGAWLVDKPHGIRCWSSFIAYYAYATSGRTSACKSDYSENKFSKWWYECTEGTGGKPTFMCLDRLGGHDVDKSLQDPSFKWLFDFDPLYDKRQDGIGWDEVVTRHAYRGAYTQFLTQILNVRGNPSADNEYGPDRDWPHSDRYYDQTAFYYRRPAEGAQTNGVGGQWIQYDYQCDETDGRK